MDNLSAIKRLKTIWLVVADTQSAVGDEGVEQIVSERIVDWVTQADIPGTPPSMEVAGEAVQRYDDGRCPTLCTNSLHRLVERLVNFAKAQAAFGGRKTNIAGNRMIADVIDDEIGGARRAIAIDNQPRIALHNQRCVEMMAKAPGDCLSPGIEAMMTRQN